MKTFLLTLLLFLSSTSAAMAQPTEQTATFAGGCFWCMQVYFDNTKGITHTVVGYTGGTDKDPTYEEVSGGKTGHMEAIEIGFDPAVISYDEVLDIYWMHIDPTDAGGQFVDRGSQYHTAIFTHDDAQKKAAEASKTRIAKELGKPVVTQILPAQTFYAAEEYHQEFYKKDPAHYERYDRGNGRKQRLQELWGK